MTADPQDWFEHHPPPATDPLVGTEAGREGSIEVDAAHAVAAPIATVGSIDATGVAALLDRGSDLQGHVGLRGAHRLGQSSSGSWHVHPFRERERTEGGERWAAPLEHPGRHLVRRKGNFPWPPTSMSV